MKRYRLLALVVGLYLALDFTNPTLPGAVQLVDGALEAVAASQARSVEGPSSLLAPLARHVSTPEPRVAPPPRTVRPVARLALALRAAHAPPDPRSSLPSSLDDD